MAGKQRDGDRVNEPQNSQCSTIAPGDRASLLLDQWAASLAQVLESMTDEKPEVQWQRCTAPSADQDILWWEQPFQAGPGMTVWVGAPHATWEQAGTVTLKAAGLETVEAAEARSTWLEILSQSLAVMARGIGSFLGREVACEAGAERLPDMNLREWASASLIFQQGPLAPLSIGFSPKLLSAILAPAASPAAAAGPYEVTPASEPQPLQVVHRAAVSPAMDVLMDVELPVSISFGKTQLPMKDVLKLTTGSIVELNRGVNDTVEVMVNHCLIARGEVVVVDGNYGVRIQQIASPQERLRSVR